MCFRKSKALLLGLALSLLLSPAIYSVDVYRGEPERMFQIPESELQELEEIFKRQAQTIEQLQIVLRQQHATIGELQTTLIRQQTTISRLEISFDEYESAVRWRMIRNVGIAGGVGFGLGLLVIGQFGGAR